MPEKKLQVRDLRISFRTNNGKVQAVRGISFDLYKGETLAIVGESGSGKSVTSKSILGIQAGNAIYEGGQVLYDGQDLLKISEDDFYKLRGDKVAMIFQDPLSSLNPIMRIGKQLTEAMLLKGKSRQRSSKASFTTVLSLLEKCTVEAVPKDKDTISADFKTFKAFELHHTKLEQAYNTAHDSADEAVSEIRNILYLIEKNALTDVGNARAAFKKIREFAKQSANKYVVDNEVALHSVIKEVGNETRSQIKSCSLNNTQTALNKLLEILETALKREKPDFFALGYCEYKGIDIQKYDSIPEMNAACNKELSASFLDAFISKISLGLSINDDKYTVARKKALALFEKYLPIFRNINIDDNELHNAIKELCDAVAASVNPLDLVKDSASCTFSGTMKDFEQTWNTGKRTNSKKLAKHEAQLKKYNAIVAKGKEPDWKVTDAEVINLEQVLQNIVSHLEYMSEHYRALLSNEKDSLKEAHAAIEYLKENASAMVFKVTKHAAKNKALKLMEEVGIPEPRKRYRQYPFEFSGGMRQRIVIAIALAANPDILICDEPTTALDVTIQAQILELINKIKRERQLSVIFITHDLGVVANMADRIAVMYAGKVVEYGTAEEVFYSPAHPYTWALLSSMPDLDTKEKLEAIPGTPPNMIYPPKGDAFAERNRYAMQIDFEQQPPEFEITPTHWAATWLLHPDAPHIDPPKSVTDRIAKMKERIGGAKNEQ